MAADHDPDVDRRALELRKGDPDAVADWFEAERPVVYRLCLGFVADAAEAEDATQVALLRLCDRIEQWDPARAYGPWRNTLVLNICRDRMRSQQRREHHERLASDRPAGILPDPGEVVEAAELRDALAAALALLPPREREAFVLRDLEGHDTDAVAAQLDVRPATVRAMLCLARRRLRDALADRLPAGFAFGGGEE